MSSLSTISIKRPVLAMVMNIIIVIFGVIGFSYLGVREFPSVDPPVISVLTIPEILKACRGGAGGRGEACRYARG